MVVESRPLRTKVEFQQTPASGEQKNTLMKENTRVQLTLKQPMLSLVPKQECKTLWRLDGLEYYFLLLLFTSEEVKFTVRITF